MFLAVDRVGTGTYETQLHHHDPIRNDCIRVQRSIRSQLEQCECPFIWIKRQDRFTEGSKGAVPKLNKPTPGE